MDDEADSQFDIDGDGTTAPWEMNLCRLCLMAMLVLAFGKEAVTLL